MCIKADPRSMLCLVNLISHEFQNLVVPDSVIFCTEYWVRPVTLPNCLFLAHYEFEFDTLDLHLQI